MPTTILQIILQLLRGLAAKAEADATRAQIELQRIAITESEKIYDEIKTLEKQITDYRRLRTPDADRIADELLVRANRRSALLASVASGLPIPVERSAG